MTFDENLEKIFLKSGRFYRCELGRPELNKICNLAYKNKRGSLLCGALIGWTKYLEVEGLESCFLTARNELKLKIANRRNKAR